MIPLCRPQLCGNEARYLQECISSGFVSSVGPFVTRFEKMVAQAAGTARAVATSSGTTALHLALVTAGVQPGDLVAIPSFTFIATANTVAHCGAVPWLFDMRPTDWCMDAEEMAEALAAETTRRAEGVFHKPTGRRLAAIMPVYVLGLVPDMAPFRRIAADYGLPLLADAAAALGATRDGLPAGAFADMSCFSFNGNKTVTAGGGGAVVGGNPDLMTRVHHLSTTARVGPDYEHDAVGFNYRMTNIEAAVGCAQLENLVRFVAQKRRIRDLYRTAFSNMQDLELFPEAPDLGNVCWFSGIVLPPNGPTPRDCCARLKSSGIEARPFWKPVHLQVPYARVPRTSLRVTEKYWNRILTLPCSTDLAEAEQGRVVDALSALLHS